MIGIPFGKIKRRWKDPFGSLSEDEVTITMPDDEVTIRLSIDDAEMILAVLYKAVIKAKENAERMNQR